MRSLACQGRDGGVLLTSDAAAVLRCHVVSRSNNDVPCRGDIGVVGRGRCAVPCRHIVTKQVCYEAETTNTDGHYVRVYVCQYCGVWLDDDTRTGRLRVRKDPRCQL